MQITTSQFTPNHRMRQYLTAYKQGSQMFIILPQMIDQNRSVNQNSGHYSSKPDCRRDIGLTSGSEPPNKARHKALSRSIKAFKPSRNKAVFSRTPVNSTALAYKPSSIFNVVRIVFSKKHHTRHHCMPVLMTCLHYPAYWVSS